MLRSYLPDIKRSLLLHLALFILLVVAISQRSTKISMPEPKEEINIVDATAVDESQIQAELDRLKAIEDRRKQKQRNEQQALERQAQQAKDQRRKEEQRLANLKKKRALEQKKYKEKLARIKAEEEALAKKRAAEKKRLEELENQRKAAEAAEDKRQKEEQLRKQIEEEEKRQAIERKKQNQAIVDKYRELIFAAIDRNWILPPTARPDMEVHIRVRLLPTGEVVGIEIIKSSGDTAVDRSAEQAVRKSSPFNVPKDSALFNENFRDLTLKLRPRK